jgi:predicted nuclease with TOPRIM domain
LLVFTHRQSGAGSEAKRIQKEVTQAIEIRQETQKNEDAWAGKKAGLMSRYRTLISQKENLEKAKTCIKERLKGQQNLVAEIERRTSESERIRDELQSCLESIVTRLGEFIKRDLSFLTKERSYRLDSIRETLSRPDKTATEKLRRVMEALQVEAEYGRTVEVYQDTIDLDGQHVLVDVLRLGRLSLFCQTPDSKTVGHYNRATGRWVSLSPGYRRNINKAVDMARRERVIDLIKLPIGRINVP